MSVQERIDALKQRPLLTTKEATERLTELGIEAKAVHTKAPFAGNPYAKNTTEGRAYIWVAGWTPDELRAIASHMEAQ